MVDLRNEFNWAMGEIERLHLAGEDYSSVLEVFKAYNKDLLKPEYADCILFLENMDITCCSGPGA